MDQAFAGQSAHKEQMNIFQQKKKLKGPAQVIRRA
jgi:hypothetical protein